MTVDAITRIDPGLLEVLDDANMRVPRGQPRRSVAAVANALAERAPETERRTALEEAAEQLWSDEARGSVEGAFRSSDVEPPATFGSPPRENVVALTLAYWAALPVLARDERIQAPLRGLEGTFADLDEDDRLRLGPVLARAATPALPLDIAAAKDDGYYFVSVFPPEGSEGVDIAGKAAKWLTRRMTMESDAPRIVMRRFLSVLAEEIEVDLPSVSATLDLLVAEAAPAAPAADRLFVALARGLVDEAVAERGFPF